MAKKIIVAADDLEDIRRIQPALAEQEYELVVAMRGTSKPYWNAVEHGALAGDCGNEEEREAFRRRLITAEYIAEVRQQIGGLRCDLVCDLSSIQGFAELAENEAGADSEAGQYINTVIQLANRCTDRIIQCERYLRSLHLNEDRLSDSAAGFEKHEKS